MDFSSRAPSMFRQLFSHWVEILVLSVVILAASWALLRPGWFFVHDTLQVARVAEMHRALSEGHWPPRWSQHFGYGYGIPLFEFYAPLPYYFGGLLLSLGASTELIFKSLLFVPTLVMSLATYRLSRKLMPNWLALVATALVVLAPYRALNLFVRGAVSESWGTMFFPVILLNIWNLTEKRPWSWLWLSLSLAGLALSHNITSLLFIPFSLVFALSVIWIKQKSPKLRSFLSLLGSYGLAFGLSAYYVLPAFFEKNLVSISAATDEYYSVLNHFVFLRQFITPFWGYGGSQPGLADELSFFLGYGTWLAVIAAALVMFAKLTMLRGTLTKGVKQWSWPFVVGGLTIAALVMTTSRSQFIWESVPILSFVQFPWRYLGIATFFLGLFIAMLLNVSLSAAKLTWSSALLILVVIGTQIGYFRPESWLANPEQYYFTDVKRMDKELGPTLKEYLPRQLVENPTPATGELVKRLDLDSTIEVLQMRVHHQMVRVTALEPSTIIWQTAFYPGWQVFQDGQPAQLSIADTGLIQQAVPAGTTTLELKWTPTPVRKISDIITLVTLLVTLFLCFRQVTIESHVPHAKR